MANHPDELRADFQQYYGLNLDGMGRYYSTLHAAALCAQLPEGARTLVALDPDNAWTTDRMLAAAMVNDLAWLVWSKTKDGEKNRNRPKPIGRGTERARHVRGMAMEPDELLAKIERIREEARRG